MPTPRETVEHISGREFETRLRRGEEIVLIDARGEHGYMVSNIRPKGSIRVAPGATDGSFDQLPKDKLIVTT